VLVRKVKVDSSFGLVLEEYILRALSRETGIGALSFITGTFVCSK